MTARRANEMTMMEETGDRDSWESQTPIPPLVSSSLNTAGGLAKVSVHHFCGYADAI